MAASRSGGMAALPGAKGAGSARRPRDRRAARRLLRGLLLALLPACALAGDAPPPVAALGGETSRIARGFTALSLPAANLTDAQVRAFFPGLLLFNQPWGVTPSPDQAGLGLGRLHNAAACGDCHLRDGRGLPPEAGVRLTTVTLQLAVPDAAGWQPDPRYGRQLQPLATAGPPEGRPSIAWEEIRGHYPDGRTYRLRRPLPQVTDLSAGPLPPETALSLRLAPTMSGLGLLEALPEQLLLQRHDPDDGDGDGISGQARWLESEGQRRLGRFGWKADSPDLRSQAALAAWEDLGLSSSLHPDEPTVELDEAALKALTFYSQSLAVPLAEGLTEPQAQAGAALFAELGCGGCHLADLTTGPHPVAAFGGQRIYPYTDLLLHDMGPGLADRDLSGQISQTPLAAEWRTPPLWGLGRARQVSGKWALLHDGRARSPAEAILWHGGEAAATRRAFMALPLAHRQALLAFLDAL
ncbi:MAG: di-heme oxidoredictase family protein [Rhodospirillales bacterium]